jgi:hypothetical protein
MFDVLLSITHMGFTHDQWEVILIIFAIGTVVCIPVLIFGIISFGCGLPKDGIICTAVFLFFFFIWWISNSTINNWEGEDNQTVQNTP